jgi:hypothetical protein
MSIRWGRRADKYSRQNRFLSQLPVTKEPILLRIFGPAGPMQRGEIKPSIYKMDGCNVLGRPEVGCGIMWTARVPL